MAGPMEPRTKRSPRIRIAAVFIEWVVGAAALGGVFAFFHGWSDGGASMFLGALFVGILAFMAHAAVILFSEA